jgi:hypothetical protein
LLLCFFQVSGSAFSRANARSHQLFVTLRDSFYLVASPLRHSRQQGYKKTACAGAGSKLNLR